MNKVFVKLYLLAVVVLLPSCESNNSHVIDETTETKAEIKLKNLKYGYDLDQFRIVKKKIRRGDTFSSILEDNGINYPEVYNILQNIKNKVSVKRLVTGKTYKLLYTKDSIASPKAFIYEPEMESYNVIQLRDSIYGKKVTKPIKVMLKEGNGLIENSLYETMANSGLNDQLTYYLADVYAWNIDFYRLHKGDRFKVIYTEKFVDDSVSIGVERIKAAIFQHAGKDFYAFEFQPDSLKGIVEYFDENAKNLRRVFLKAPVKFGPVTSRYNLKRRISYYNNRIKPHRGTDFAASVGTPILTTADGIVVNSSYSRGNGNYVTIRHNNTYSTQYLHMKRRKVKKGQFVTQGEVIGWLGMTGYTSGPHVCYRFWKNGRQVDPFRQKLPEAKPISNQLKFNYLNAIVDLKTQLDCISFFTESTYINSAIALTESDIK
ncbi:MAG: peptidase M23 [Flavobacteriaceae bacterium TMED171]|nr:peptidase M23 [Flavobacteriaceae bacterium]OUW31251.1 MAG: peptidase M23 [Flavobacteriaceae bacterium TMED171]|tara:strand:- start:2045 stop:3340 length:1296 start_codon:yes stop_codon:yes gene_type:complete